MDRQGVFDQVTTHLLTQNAKSDDSSWDQTPMCLYRARKNLKCAIGGIIRDEFYKPELEGHGVDHPDVLRAVELSLGCKIVEQRDEDLLKELQSVHDMHPVSKWHKTLSLLASMMRLKFNPPKE